jgi:signal transduction histidine kinase
MMADSQRVLQRMIVSTINAREVEANRVSRILHDEVGQVLSAVGLQLDVLKLDYKHKEPELVARVNEIQAMLDHAVHQVRTLSYDLNPSVVERVGLQLALERLIGRMRSESNVAIRLLYDPALRPPALVSAAWHKIAEHALDNAVKHSGASRIEVQVKRSKTRSVLEVRDNGRGFSPPDAMLEPAGLGLLLMQHYALEAPISLDVMSTPGTGTTVRSTHAAEEPPGHVQTRR